MKQVESDEIDDNPPLMPVAEKVIQVATGVGSVHSDRIWTGFTTDYLKLFEFGRYMGNIGKVITFLRREARFPCALLGCLAFFIVFSVFFRLLPSREHSFVKDGERIAFVYIELIPPSPGNKFAAWRHNARCKRRSHGVAPLLFHLSQMILLFQIARTHGYSMERFPKACLWLGSVYAWGKWGGAVQRASQTGLKGVKRRPNVEEAEKCEP